ncbi:MAG: FAD/NAD(P)-binding protein [Verrucomicrobia bacterium]|nr:FAD/NAD(P)-binding protein [Verrucomicrobiota bacterium]
MSAESISTIAIIGGGVSGCLVAVQLLREARAPLRILLFERMTDVGRGVAYGTENREHLLNVPAARMSALPDEPGHFLRWAAGRAGEEGYPATVTAADFLPRWIFGEYIRAVLAEARGGAAPGVELEQIKGDVTDLETEAGGVRLRCGDGRSFGADRVVLALGNLPGEYPIKRPLPVYHSQRYVHVPWHPGALAGIPPGADVLIVGAGLTAVDMVLQLQEAGHQGVVHALSRRGLRPQVHEQHAAYPDFFVEEPPPATILKLWRRVRAEVRKAGGSGIDWRPVLDALRPRTPAIWGALSWEERARFMRHVRPFWEAHRHRLAPTVAKKIEIRRAAGKLRFYAGRLDSLIETPDGVEAKFRERGTTRKQILHVAKVINCTGPRSDYSKYQHPLLVNLLARGLIDHDPLALGLNALPDGTVLGYRSGPVGWLFTLGVSLKGVLWECSAVPEIRDQAQRLARRLLV